METINKRVRGVRETLGLTSADFARKLEVKSGTVSMLETGTSKPGAEIMTKLLEIFSVDTNWLLTGEGEMFLGGKTPDLTALPIKEKKEVVKAVEVPVANVSFLEKQVLWLQSMIEKLQRENELLIAK